MINAIRVYDPKSDGIDGVQYNKIVKCLKSINPAAANMFEDGLSDKVFHSEVSKDLTLEQFLFRGPLGYLTSRGQPSTVVFVDGKFHSQYDGRDAPTSEDLQKISIETNAVPFAYCIDPDLDEYCKTLSHLDDLRKKIK